MIADIFPFDNAVNKAEEKILLPENRKLNEKMTNPVFVISKISLLFSTNSLTICFPVKKENKNINNEIVMTEPKQIQTTFFSCLLFPLP